MQNSDGERITELYNMYSDDIYRYLNFLINDHHKAEDLTQETYFKVIRKIEYAVIKNEKNWIFTIARHVAIDYLRKHKNIQNLPLRDEEKSQDKTPEEIAEHKDDIHQLYLSIKTLKIPYQEVLYFRKIEELSTKETAKILNWSDSKVKNNLQRAMRSIRNILSKEVG